MMGVAAYNRGTAVVRGEASAQLADAMPAIEHRAHRQRIRDLESQLRAKLEQSIRDREQAMRLIRSLRVKLDESRQQAGFWKRQAAKFMKAFNSARRSWMRAEELLRMLSPEQVQGLRDVRDMYEQ